MSDKTKIQWTETTWNPVRGCSRVSAGCMNCYAETMAARFSGPGQPYEGLIQSTSGGPRWNGAVKFVEEHLADPLRWKRPRRIFVNSMSDLFHEALTNEQIAAIFGVMAAAPQHTFQGLTKRAARAREWFAWIASRPFEGPHAIPGGPWDPMAVALWYTKKAGVELPSAPRAAAWPLPNVWLGVSVEDQASADARIPLLLETAAAVRWVSYEPALGPVDFRRWTGPLSCGRAMWYGDGRPAWCGEPCFGPDPINPARFACPAHGGPPAHPRLDWIVVGGESGPGARPFDVAWARSTVAACKAAGVPVFVKQLGARPYDSDAARSIYGHGEAAQSNGALAFRDRKGGDPEEWPEDLRVREWPGVSA